MELERGFEAQLFDLVSLVVLAGSPRNHPRGGDNHRRVDTQSLATTSGYPAWTDAFLLLVG